MSSPIDRMLVSEVESGTYLSGDHMDKFGTILETNTTYRYVSTFFIQHIVDLIQSVPTPHIQILFSNKQMKASEIGHFIVVFHDGNRLYVFDSLNNRFLSPDQMAFIDRLFPNITIEPMFVQVQHQENLIDCGVFAIANATSLALGLNPARQLYIVHEMRPHLANMFRTGVLTPFPSQPLENIILNNIPPSPQFNMDQDFPPKDFPPIASNVMFSSHYHSPAHKFIENKPPNNIPPSPQFDMDQDFPPIASNILFASHSHSPDHKFIENKPLEGKPSSNTLFTPPSQTVYNEHIDNEALHIKTSPNLFDMDLDFPILLPNNNPRRPGRPPKKTKGRPQTSELSKAEQHRKAVKRYADDHPDVNRNAVKRYNKNNPDVNQKAVKKYSISHPEVNKQSVIKYKEKNKANVNKEKSVRKAIPKKLIKADLIAVNSGESLQEIDCHRLKQESLKCPKVYKCSYCQAPMFEEERGREKWCCGKGAYHIKLPALNGQFYKSNSFLKDARSFNNLFAFSAIGVTGGFQKPTTGGISFVKILGRTYHRVFDLSWHAGPNNCGMYVDDGLERLRLAAGRSLDENITQEITSYLNEVNPFIPVLRQLSNETSEEAHIIFQKTNRKTHGSVLGDVPVANEIAAIINTDISSHSSREVVIWNIGDSKPHTINMFHPSYECLQYPLLFPHGSEGWFIGKKDNNRNKISQVKYYRHLLLSEPRFTHMRRLSQEYFVDMYCRTEEERLNFIKYNQGSVLRIATREEIDETIVGEGGMQTGRIYLPSSFTNSPRYMQVKYQDAMAIVNRLGKPTYFLTFTCNPKWEEIQKSINEGEKVQDRPDICNRVFQLRLNFLLKELKSGKMFGKIIYILHVIEFQKRGLPHAHICFKIESNGPVEQGKIDLVVRATIPSESEKRLRDLVLDHMIHGPACQDRKSLPCFDHVKKVCTKGYPKPETEETHVDDKGFVHYKRSKNNTATIKRSNKLYNVNDCDVVPYNPALTLQLECHANLEIASTRKIVKYLFKYIHKGPDAVRVSVVSERQQETDEIEDYVTRRYIGASDAIWRILEFDITGRFPTVIQLPVHLPNKDHVVFRPGDEQSALDKSVSKLNLYMERPQTEEFLNLTYCEFFESYILDTKPKKESIAKIDKYYLTERKRGQVIARIYWVSPLLGELYYLRILLQRIPCFSYENLRTVEGVVNPTFQEAARSIGLLNDENEYFDVLKDAAVFMTGPSLRKLFYILISNGASAVTLWEHFKTTLCEDFLQLMPHDSEKAISMGLCHLDRILRNHGSSLVDMGLPAVNDATSEVEREYLNWNSKSCLEFVNHWLPKLSEEQQQIFEVIKSMFLGKIPNKAMFIDGAGGTGKTLLLNVVTAYFRFENRVVLCTATTGVAALLHDGGVTAHSKFKLPLDTSDCTSFWNVVGNSQRAELIRQSSVIIWDEAPMAHKTTIEVLDRSLQNLMGNNEIFGGKILIFSGDFRQIPPVVQSSTSCDAVSVTIKRSHLWKHFFKVDLNLLQRSKDDTTFSKFVLSVGNGSIQNVEVDCKKCIPLNGISFVNSLADLITFVYPSEILKNPDECCGRAILSGTNICIKEINSTILSLIPGEAIELLSADTCVSESTNDEVIHTELLNTISQPGVPDHKLILKVGAVCILMRNLCFDDKLVNGSKLIVTNISRFCVSTRRPNSDDVITIPRITFKFSAGRTGMEIIRRQFPLQLAFGLTINKSQGQTLNTVGVDLRNDVFAHGQLYVALSRVRTSRNIKVLVPLSKIIDGVAHCVNVVHQQLIC